MGLVLGAFQTEGISSAFMDWSYLHTTERYEGALWFSALATALARSVE